MEYKKVIGVEVHVELNTKTKIFCGCSTEFGKKPNTHVCPVCLGLPGGLPVLNKKVVKYAIKTGLALNCSINKNTRMDRKNYFYADCPKSYQISQDPYPICKEGYIDINLGEKHKRIRIERIHMEEDAGKLIHKEDYTLVDFNRAGVPLLEIVSKPDMNSEKEVVEFLKSLKDILIALKVSDCKMEEGSLRCDLNISINEENSSQLGVRSEIKNLNSFKSVEKAVRYEFKRQRKILEGGGRVSRQTRRWVENKDITIAMRDKEEEKDYRYFPEGDIMSINIPDTWIEEARNLMPELPKEKIERYKNNYKLSKEEAENLIYDIEVSKYFEEVCKTSNKFKDIYNWITGDIFAYLKEKNITINKYKVIPKWLGEIINLVNEGKISNNIGKKLLSLTIKEEKNPKIIVEERNLVQNNDENEILKLIEEILQENPQNVKDLKNGKTNLFSWFMGQIMKKSKGKANPKLVKEILEEQLKNR